MRSLLALLALLPLAGPARAFTAADTHTPLSAQVLAGGVVALQGRIVPGSEGVVRAALDRAGAGRPTVLVDSPGGAIAPALAIGRLIRARGLAVAVARLGGTAREDPRHPAPPPPGIERGCAGSPAHPCPAGARPTDADAGCASACVLVLAAGVERSVGPGAGVGVHRLVDWTTYSRTWDVYRVQRRRGVVVGRELLSRRVLSRREVYTEAPPRDYAAVERYLAEMGETPELVALMRGTPAARLHWMTPAELVATRLATDRDAVGPKG